MRHRIHPDHHRRHPERVWEILTDLASYRDWNPFVVEAEGTVAVGQRLTTCGGASRLVVADPVAARTLIHTAGPPESGRSLGR